jgi:predicted Fe-Mo cluster-binding NifX family protein
MKICFPVTKNEGFDSAVYNHFGSAPVFVVVDTVANDVSSIDNKDQHHTHGSCNPMKALDGKMVDAIVVGGIGAGALTRLNQLGIRVHRAQGATIRDNIALLTENKLPVLTLQGCCGGHTADGGCAH